MKKFYLFALAALTATSAFAQGRVSVHDPSIFVDVNSDASNPTYYIYGSHLACAKTTAKDNYKRWTAFGNGETTSCNLFANTSGKQVSYSNAYNTHAITKVKNFEGKEVQFGNFNAHEWQYSGYKIQGNQWAPDVVWNKTMNKWCMYMSVNGDHWASVIVCMTSDKPEGPWVYQGPVVFSGFQGSFDHVGFDKTNDYKQTDLEIAIGEQASLPERYKQGSKWGEFWPNCIDPCVFYDEEGKLWMSYGSWSGGIFIFELDETTGLRDYTVKYETKFSSGTDYRNCIEDPYFGKKIAGGYYVSGEASYIQYFNGYYYMFVTYGGLAANEGYQMRVFRSENPDGPYKDCNTTKGIDAVYNKYMLNFGATANRDEGVKLFGHYKWPSMTSAEVAQGHNSATVDHNGHLLLVNHTRFNNKGEGHEVRVHEMFQNEDGWLVAAPFEYSGETPTQDDIANTELYKPSEVAGVYGFMAHPYRQDNKASVFEKPVDIQLNHDGTVSGEYTGTWSISNSFITLKLKGEKTNKTNVTFKGVLTEQTTDGSGAKKTLCFTALSSSSGDATASGKAVQTRALSVWGSKTADLETAIDQIANDADETPAVIYDILGRRQETTRKGINIINGRKVIVR